MAYRMTSQPAHRKYSNLGKLSLKPVTSPTRHQCVQHGKASKRIEKHILGAHQHKCQNLESGPSDPTTIALVTGGYFWIILLSWFGMKQISLPWVAGSCRPDPCFRSFARPSHNFFGLGWANLSAGLSHYFIILYIYFSNLVFQLAQFKAAINRGMYSVRQNLKKYESCCAGRGCQKLSQRKLKRGQTAGGCAIVNGFAWIGNLIEAVAILSQAETKEGDKANMNTTWIYAGYYWSVIWICIPVLYT